SYDAHGNPTSITTNGLERRITYDTAALFPTQEHVGDFVWTATWNPVIGALDTLTDPNGHITTLSYDSLGRYTGVAIDGRARHVVVEYDWTPPFPKTTTWQFDGALGDVTEKPASWSATGRWRQTVEVANGKGQVRYHAVRFADAQWIISGYH